MISLFLASYLATQTWAWDMSPEPDVTAYRIYFSAGMTTWCAQDRVEVVPDCWEATPGFWRCQGEVPEPQFSPVFFIVTAVDSSGNESDTDHGEVQFCP